MILLDDKKIIKRQDTRMYSNSILVNVTRYRIVVEFKADFPAIDYIGSKLRGAFGWALRNLSCSTKQPTCEGCQISNACPFAQLFAPEHLCRSENSKLRAPSAPYLIQILDDSSLAYIKDEQLAFDFVLIGQYQNYLPLLIEAWKRACEHGLGTNRSKIPLQLLNVYQQQEELNNWSIVYDYALGLIDYSFSNVVVPQIISANSKMVDFDIHFTTPLRLQKKSKPVQVTELTPHSFLIGLKRRINTLNDSYLKSKDLTKNLRFINEKQIRTIVTNEKSLYWFNWQRYSHRQKQYMNFDGIKGTWHWSVPASNLENIWTMLYLGQWLNLGKNTTFGLGQYEIEFK